MFLYPFSLHCSALPLSHSIVPYVPASSLLQVEEVSRQSQQTPSTDYEPLSLLVAGCVSRWAWAGSRCGRARGALTGREVKVSVSHGIWIPLWSWRWPLLQYIDGWGSVEEAALRLFVLYLILLPTCQANTFLKHQGNPERPIFSCKGCLSG